MKEFLIRPIDIFEIIQRQKKLMFSVLGGSILFCLFVFTVMPRTYMSETVVHIGVNYFQNPLIGNLISQTHDPGELRSEREKVIRSSLGVDFANKMGEKFKLFDTEKSTDPNRATEVEYFLKTIHVSSITPTQFKIVYKANDPDVADGVIRGALAAIRESMYFSRIESLQQLLSVLETEMARANGENPSNSPTIAMGANSELAKNQIKLQIELLQRRLDDLRRTYSEQHPSVTAVKSEIAELQAAERSGIAPHLARRALLGGGKGGSSVLGMMTIKDDLSKQRHLVNISLEMEQKDPSMNNYVSLIKEPVYPKKPSFPKPKLFILFSCVTSVIFATLAAALSEFYLRTPISPNSLAKKLNTKILGTLELG